MSRKINDGGRAGLKQDKFRHSRFEMDSRPVEDQHFGGASKRSSTTLRSRWTGNFGKGPKGYQRPDQSIYEDVCHTLLISRDVDASRIEVKVNAGVVYLQGSVSDRRSKKLAELEVESISGVRDVHNQLTFIPGDVKEKDLH
jgi:osmotically-inducible protein OsmY